LIQAVQEVMRVTLAASAAFQAMVGAGSASAALARIYHDELPKPASGQQSHSLVEMNALRPCAVVYTQVGQGGFRADRDAMGNGCWNNSGTLVVVLMRNVPVEDKNDLSKVDTDFRTIAGDIIEDLIGLNETAGYLTMDRIDAMGPYRTEVKELQSIGDAQVYELVIAWGQR
jgi:hypothetical protein